MPSRRLVGKDRQPATGQPAIARQPAPAARRVGRHAADLLALQRTIGNRRVSRALNEKTQGYMRPAPDRGVPGARYVRCVARPLVQREIEFDYSRIKETDLVLVKQVAEQAIKYMLSTKVGAEVWKELQEAQAQIQVQVRADDFAPTTFSAFNLFGPDEEETNLKKALGVTRNLFVRWNVLDLNKFDPKNKHTLLPNKDIDTQSAANALLHELGHARQILHPHMRSHVMDWKKGERQALKSGNRDLVGKYNELIELHNLLNHEIPFSAETGEPLRVAYGESNVGGKSLENPTKALQDAAGRKKRPKEHISAETGLFDEMVRRRMQRLELEIMKEKLASRSYAIPSHVTEEQLEHDLSQIEDELLDEDDGSYLEAVVKPPYKV